MNIAQNMLTDFIFNPDATEYKIAMQNGFLSQEHL